MRRGLYTLLALSISACTASVATATEIDFSDPEWSNAFFKSSYEHRYTSGDLAGLTVRLDAAPFPALIWQDSADGLGVVYSFENDEIEQNEILKVSFSEDVTLNAASLADFFVVGGNAEEGRYSVDQGQTWTRFHAVPTATANGESGLDLGGISAGSIWFGGPNNNLTATGFWSTFALKGLDISYNGSGSGGGDTGGDGGGMGGGGDAEVPEPSTLLLLASALAGARRKLLV